MRRLLLIVFLLPLVLMAAPLKFESYSVVLHPITKYAPTKIPKSGIDWKMEDFLQYTDKDALNFADNYTLVKVGCGTGCVEYCLIDRVSGMVYPGTDFNQDFPNNYNGPAGFQFHRDSKLLVVYHADSFEYPVHVSYYVWEDKKLKLLQTDEIQASK
jgi:hypothetical protein